MRDGGRGSASIGVEMWKSSQKWSAQRSAVHSIAWLDVSGIVWSSRRRQRLLPIEAQNRREDNQQGEQAQEPEKYETLTSGDEKDVRMLLHPINVTSLKVLYGGAHSDEICVESGSATKRCESGERETQNYSVMRVHI
jgi:hypothetical protein